MASVLTKKMANGKNGYIVRAYIHGKQESFHGFRDKRDAGRAGEHIDSLETARKTGGKVPADTELWVAKLMESGSSLYAKLATLGLVEPIQEKHTLEDLIVRHRESLVNVTNATKEVYAKPERNLRDFFGADYALEKITTSRADEFAAWLRTEPLHQRRKEKIPYSPTTANKRITYTKQLFKYAKRIGWIAENPFTDVPGGTSANPEKWEYVDKETVMRVIDATKDPKWRAKIALGRFAGVRGSSELYDMTWDDVKWSSDGEPGYLIVKAVKNKRHGRVSRSVPMHPVVERELEVLFNQAAEGETHVFPGMEKKTSFGTMTERHIANAGVPLWQEPWYNLRKSFCCDLMENGIDPVVYEKITDHTYEVAMKHYQIPHTARLQKGHEKILEAWGLKKELKKILVEDSKSDLQCPHENGRITQRHSQVPQKCVSDQEKENVCDFLQTLSAEDTRFELATPYGAPHFQ